VENCIHCAKRLFGKVKFCPFCGTATDVVPAMAKAQTLVLGGFVASEADAPKAQQYITSAPIRNAPEVSARRVEAPPAAVQETRGVHREADIAAPAIPQPAIESMASQSIPPKSKKSRKFWGYTGIGAVALVALLAFLGSGPSKQDLACNQQIDEGRRLAQSDDLIGAATQSELAIASCTGDLSAKANELKMIVATAQATQRQCTRSYEAVTAHLEKGRLGAAVDGLNQLPSACADSDDAIRIKEQVKQTSAAANTDEQRVRAAITSGDAVAAVEAIDDLARLDRFRPTLASLRAQIAEIPVSKPVEPAPQQNTPTPVATTQPFTIQPAALPVVKPSAPTFNSEAVVAQQFLNDAQTALAQNRFDAAKTYIDSARRMDPTNPRIDALARIVQDREHQVLQNETTIK